LIRVALAGERGKTGSAVAAGLRAAEDVDYVGGFGRDTDPKAFLAETKPDVLVSFTLADAEPALSLAAVAAGVRPVIGTTGLSQGTLDDIQAACSVAGLGGVWASNFAIGAVVMMWLAEKADPYFEAVEIIESHHATKRDRPSGTAQTTAAALGRDVPIHSVRLPGIVADQEVVFGLAGQTLTIAHRTTSREAYAPGVLLAIRKVVEGPRFYRGLDSILGLD
jgi:4-hydroxy-tetrahydrodipicolinate reductase